MSKPHLLQRLFLAENALAVFCVAIALVYGVAPWLTYELVLPEWQFMQLTYLTVCSIAGMLIGSRLPLFDQRFAPGATRIVIEGRLFHGAAWTVFVVFVVVTLTTASSIPLLTALRGATADVLTEERGDFLKGRTGAEAALLYISTFLVTSIIPYSTVLLYSVKSRFRHLTALLFFGFCISFLQKALFLNLVLPLLAYLAMSNRLPRSGAMVFIGGSIALLVLGSYLSLGSSTIGGSGFSFEDPAAYLSATYVFENPFDYIIWRAVAVPVFTATDTIIVHAEQFRSMPLMGATSSFIAALSGVERINMERIVFEHQFGGWNDIANSNAVFITDAFINFDWIGLFLMSVVIGQVFRWFRISQDIGFRSLWPLFALVLFTAPFIGLLLSNGFAYMLFHATLLKIRSTRPPDPSPSPSSSPDSPRGFAQ
jgi:hypothetical protein